MFPVSVRGRSIALVLWALASSLAADGARRGDPREAPALQNAIDKIGSEYVEASRVDPRKMVWAAAAALDREIPEVILESSARDDSLTLQVAGTRRTFPVAAVHTLADVSQSVREILRFVHEHRTPPADRSAAEYVAINGMLATLDPHSILFDPAQARAFRTQIANRFFGIGITFDARTPGQSPVIRTVFADGPASESGIAACDRIIAVEGRLASEMSVDEMVDRIMGLEGTTVWMTFQRDGAGLLERVLTRRQIKLPSVTSRLLEGGIGCLRIDRFAKGTAAEVEAAMADLRKKGATAWILDMRGNPGGLLSEAVRAASIFVPSGPIVTTTAEGGRRRETTSADHAATEKGPVVALIGPFTASAAEVMVAAIQNRDRGLVLGRTSWGKGSVQVLFDNSDGSILKLTIAHYLTPGGVSLQSRGITPDVELLPVPVPRPNRIRLTAAGSEGEAGLEQAFAARETARSADASLRYVAASPDAEEEVQIAHDLILQASSRTRTEAFALARPFLEDRRESEEERIVRVLGEAGIDWSSGTPDGEAKVHVRCAQHGPAATGERVLVDCDVSNDGSGDAFRVLGHAPDRAFDLFDQEIVVGRVAAGTRRTVTFEGPLAEDPSPRVSYVPFTFSEDGGGAVEFAPLRIEAGSRLGPAADGAARHPDIRIEGGTPETSADTYHLRATIRDRAEVRDAWVRVSNQQTKVDRKKVLYQARVPGGPPGELDLSGDVPLSPGLNELTVCARAGDRERCENHFVLRRPPSSR